MKLPKSPDRVAAKLARQSILAGAAARPRGSASSQTASWSRSPRSGRRTRSTASPMRWPRRWRDALRQPGRLRSPDLRAVRARPRWPSRCPSADVPASRRCRRCPRSTGGRAAAAAGSRRARRGAALHEPVAAEHVDRHALLSARLVHDEVQPQAERGLARLPRLRRSASATSRTSTVQGVLQLLYELQQILAEIAGLDARLAAAGGRRAGRADRPADGRAPIIATGARQRTKVLDPRQRPRHQPGHRRAGRLRGRRRSRATRDGLVDLDDVEAPARRPDAPCS